MTEARAGQVLGREITALGRRRCWMKRKAASTKALDPSLRRGPGGQDVSRRSKESLGSGSDAPSRDTVHVPTSTRRSPICNAAVDSSFVRAVIGHSPLKRSEFQLLTEPRIRFDLEIFHSGVGPSDIVQESFSKSSAELHAWRKAAP